MLSVPALQGLVRRRILVNYRADPAIVQRQLPAPFRPKLVNGWALAGICLIRLEQLRPKGVSAMLGMSSENAAHRIAVTWTDEHGTLQEGVYIPRRDTGALLTSALGGRLFPGEQRLARFDVREDESLLDFSMRTDDGAGDVRLLARPGDGALPAGSCFGSLEAASSFFAGGSLGYSATSEGKTLDGLRLHTFIWYMETLDVEKVRSSYYADPERWPVGSVTYDSTLIMRDIPHEWRPVPALSTTGRDCAGACTDGSAHAQLLTSSGSSAARPSR